MRADGQIIRVILHTFQRVDIESANNEQKKVIEWSSIQVLRSVQRKETL